MSTELLNRLAALESELSQLRGRRAEPDTSGLRASIVQDPLGAFARLGLTPAEIQHVQRVNVAAVMGDQAPPELRMLALQGPQIAQTNQLASTIESLSRRLDEFTNREKQEGTRQSLKALIADKAKYPHLSSAVAANPSLLDTKLKNRTGAPEELAMELEAEAKLFADAYGYKAAQPASDTNADSNAQSTQSKPATPVGNTIGDVPPLPKPQQGVLTSDEDERIKQEIYRKYPSLAPIKRPG